MPALPTYRVLLIDDHPIYCEGMALAVGQAMPDVAVCTAADADSALAVLAGTDIDLVLCDYRLPGDDGVNVLNRLATAHPSLALGLLCADLNTAIAGRARAIGAVACLSKERGVASMVLALQQLFDGGTVFDLDPSATGDHGLTPHRVAILERAAQGLSNKEIAIEFGISERTVKDHWTAIFHRLGVSNRISALRAAHGLNLIDFRD